MVGCVYDGVVGVVLFLEGEVPGFESGIGGFFLGAGEERDVFCAGESAGVVDGAGDFGGGREVVLEEVEGVAAEAGPSRIVLAIVSFCL